MLSKITKPLFKRDKLTQKRRYILNSTVNTINRIPKFDILLKKSNISVKKTNFKDTTSLGSKNQTLIHIRHPIIFQIKSHKNVNLSQVF